MSRRTCESVNVVVAEVLCSVAVVVVVAGAVVVVAVS